MPMQDAKLVNTLSDLLDGLGRYRAELEGIGDELDDVGELVVDPRALSKCTAHSDALIESLQPLDIQLGAVSRQADSLRAFGGLGIDLGAVASVEHGVEQLRAMVRPLRAALSGLEKARAGFIGSDDVRRQIEVIDALMLDLQAFAEVDAAFQAEIDALAEPLKAHREAVAALEARLEALQAVRDRHGRAHARLRTRLQQVGVEPAPAASGESPALEEIGQMVDAFEKARVGQVQALDALGFAGLNDRLIAFEEARAAEIPDFRDRKLDGLRRRVEAFETLNTSHQAALDAVRLGDLERDLKRLRAAQSRQVLEVERLRLGIVESQIQAIEQARGRQQNAVSALSLPALRTHLGETLERLMSLSRQIADVDLRDPRTAPPVDDEEVF